jgi:hypothetical protein
VSSIAKHQSSEAQAAEQRYLEGRLRAFAKEEEWFVALAGDAVIESRFDAYSDAFTTEKPGERLKEFGDIRQAADHFSRFVLVGDPGAGKSTVLRRLATDVARARLDTERTWHVPLPLWIDLGVSANPVDAGKLLRYWWQQYDLPGTPEGYLNNQDGWLFLDGLNEMPKQGSGPKNRVDSLCALFKRYPQVPVIVTCRVRDYDKTLQLGLPIVQIHPLDGARIERFANKRLQTRAGTFLEALETDARKRMASNPYFLAMLTEIYHEWQQLPDDLRQLYEMHMNLRYQEYSNRGLMRLPWKQLKRKLQDLAFRMIADRKGTVAELEWIRQQTLPAVLSDGIDLGALVQDEKAGMVRFYHQSLHGYFALPGLTHAIRPEVPSTIRGHFISQIGDLGEASEAAVPALIGALRDESAYVRREAIRALGLIGAPAVSALITALHDEEEDVHYAAIEALGDIGTPAVSALTKALDDKSLNVCYAAALALGWIGRSAAAAVPALIAALRDESEDIRRVAAFALGDIGVSVAEAVLALIMALRDESEDVRREAVWALEDIGIPAVPALTKVNALEGISELAAEAVPVLLDAFRDESSDVRSAAAEALKKIGTPKALEALRQGRYDVEA